MTQINTTRGGVSHGQIGSHLHCRYLPQMHPTATGCTSRLDRTGMRPQSCPRTCPRDTQSALGLADKSCPARKVRTRCCLPPPSCKPNPTGSAVSHSWHPMVTAAPGPTYELTPQTVQRDDEFMPRAEPSRPAGHGRHDADDEVDAYLSSCTHSSSSNDKASHPRRTCPQHVPSNAFEHTSPRHTHTSRTASAVDGQLCLRP